MKTPMIVRWHARRAGIDDARAEELWCESVRYATTKTGWVGTPEYYGAAVNRFERLMAAEAPAAYAPHGILPMMRAQEHFWAMLLVAFHAMSVIGARTWNKLVSSPRSCPTP